MRYTLLVTSCDRHDLLLTTLRSFAECCDQPPAETIICEDGPTPIPVTIQRLSGLGRIRCISNDVRMGQAYTIDRLYEEAKTEYIFHCEDDWQFTEQGFIQPSIDILQKFPNISMVALRSDWNHPITRPTSGAHELYIAEPYWAGVWGGTCWNPGMRRLSDFKRYGGYGKHVSYGTSGLGHEKLWSKMHLDDGFRIACLPKHCRHIGDNRSRATETLEIRIPKLLIGILACHKQEYSRWESEQSPHFNRNTAFNNEPYGTDIHISGSAASGIQAVRETWARDAQAFSSHVDLKFFYGGDSPSGTPALADEVYLRGIADDYAHLPDKTIALTKYALENDFDYVFKCDSDSYVYVDRLVREMLTMRFDYAGWTQGLVCSGGPGYFLSKRAMRYVSTFKPWTWAEDVSVGQCMDAAGVKPVMLPGHKPGFSAHFFMPNGFDPNLLTPELVTAHAVKPETMRQWYAHLNDSRREACVQPVVAQSQSGQSTSVGRETGNSEA